MSFVYNFVKFLLKGMMQIFFKETAVIGMENIPEEGAVIFCGNHSNQLVDPCMILGYVKREISFLIAMKSWRLPVVGHLSRAMKSIPLERPQDVAFKGMGKVELVSTTEVTGHDTSFKKELHQSDTLIIQGRKVIIEEVVSDSELKVKNLNAEDFIGQGT